MNINSPDILKAVDHTKILVFIDIFCGGYCIIMSGVCVQSWVVGESSYKPFLGISLFAAFNLVTSTISRRSSISKVKAESIRSVVGPLTAAAAFVLTIELFNGWWMGFMIMCLWGSTLHTMLAQKPNRGRLLIGVYIAVLLACVFLFTPDTNKYHVVLFAGAIAMTGLLFVELLAQYAKVLYKQHADSLQIEQQEKMLQRLNILMEQKKQQAQDRALEVEPVKSAFNDITDVNSFLNPIIQSLQSPGVKRKICNAELHESSFAASLDPEKVEPILIKPIVKSGIRKKVKIEFLNAPSNVEVVSDESSFLANVNHIIQKELSNEHLNVDFIAREVGLSRVQLYRKMLALTGTSVSELLRSVRLQKAARLLEQKWGPVSQVAYEVGITNLSYFSKIFKAKFGIMPSEYQGLQKHAS